jgi:hypothetical protein
VSLSRLSPKLSREAIERLEVGLSEATARQDQLSGLYQLDMTHKEFRQAVESMAGALKRMQAGTVTLTAIKQLHGALKMIPENHRQILDQYGGDLFCFETTARQLNRPKVSKTDLDRLTASVEAVLGDLSQPGKGNARGQARRYVPGIHALMRAYREALPDRVISATSGGLFSRYVLVWIEAYQSREKQGDLTCQKIRDPRRHIEQAMGAEMVWEKLSL